MATTKRRPAKKKKTGRTKKKASSIVTYVKRQLKKPIFVISHGKEQLEVEKWDIDIARKTSLVEVTGEEVYNDGRCFYELVKNKPVVHGLQVTDEDGDVRTFIATRAELDSAKQSQRTVVTIDDGNSVNPSGFTITIDTTLRNLSIGCKTHAFEEWAEPNFIHDLIISEFYDERKARQLEFEAIALVNYLLETFPKKGKKSKTQVVAVLSDKVTDEDVTDDEYEFDDDDGDELDEY